MLQILATLVFRSLNLCDRNREYKFYSLNVIETILGSIYCQDNLSVQGFKMIMNTTKK